MIKNFFANKSAKSALLAIPNQNLSTSRSLATSYVYSVSQRSSRRPDGVKPRITEPPEKPQSDRESPCSAGEGGQQLDRQLPAQSDGKPRPTENSSDQEPVHDEENNQGANQSEDVARGPPGSTAGTKGNGAALSAAECHHGGPKPGPDSPAAVAPAPPLPAANDLPIRNHASVPEVDQCPTSNVIANPRIAPKKPAPAIAASSAVSKQPSPGGSSVRPALSTVASRCLKSHKVNPRFADRYTIGDELGSGGFGFVVSAIKHPENVEVAVKFICKDKVPMHAWIKDPALGLIPTEIYVLRMVDHPGIIRYVEYFEDPRYFYLVMELHGTPWNSGAAEQKLPPPSTAGK
ncbi:MAG: kinase-like domain-containing protein, partial [Olpidium bornovanus]